MKALEKDVLELLKSDARLSAKQIAAALGVAAEDLGVGSLRRPQHVLLGDAAVVLEPANDLFRGERHLELHAPSFRVLGPGLAPIINPLMGGA